MKTLAATLLLVAACSLLLSAQHRWDEGVIVSTSGDVRVGQLQYYPKWETVSFKEDSTVNTFPVHQLSQFRLFDTDLGVWRKFYAYEASYKGFKRTMFYEVIFIGEYALLRKEKAVEPVEARSLTAERLGRTDNSLVHEQVDRYNFFFRHGKEIVPLYEFKDYMRSTDRFEEIDSFAADNRLSWRSNHDIVILMNYLNCSAGETCLQELLPARLASSQ
jgi:hypothetical protein